MVKIVGITQARVGSSRLPNKVLLEIAGKPLLAYHLERVSQSKLVNKWIVATTNEPDSDKICSIAQANNIAYYKGSLTNLLDRFYQAAKDEQPDYVVRVTSDCPLVDPSLVDETITVCLENNLPYYYNQLNPAFPDGLDVEVFSFKALEEAWNKAETNFDKEHVTPFIRRKYVVADEIINHFKVPAQYAPLRVTVDEVHDFQLIKNLIETLGSNEGWIVYANYLINNKLDKFNKHIQRNEGMITSKLNETKLRHITLFDASDAHRKVIHDLIPGGAHTYSKGDDQFPQLAPAAISHGKGSHVWDLDGNEYLDCSMGLTSVSLGHAYEPVVQKVKAELDKGVNFQRPSYLEKEMAEKFLSLVPTHDMIKFAKNGSTATTAAVKLARAKTNRKIVAFPFDHPFYSIDDWFIGKSACNRGVPEEIAELSVTFKSCDINSLKALFKQYPNQIACVITEPEKSTCINGCNCSKSPEEFLKQAIELTHQNGALFIVDEMVTGFKTGFPGSMTKYGIDPDMATWGKGIANGFSFCALTGKKEVMELGGIRNIGEEKIFLVSTTHGGETHAMAAAIATIDEFQQKNVLSHLHTIGRKIVELCQYMVAKYELTNEVVIVPTIWMPTFIFKDLNGVPCSGLRTLFMQEMIKKGVLFQGIFDPCYSHTEDDAYYFAKAFGESLEVYKRALNEGYEKYLVGEPAKPVFRKFL